MLKKDIIQNLLYVYDLYLNEILSVQKFQKLQ